MLPSCRSRRFISLCTGIRSALIIAELRRRMISQLCNLCLAVFVVAYGVAEEASIHHQCFSEVTLESANGLNSTGGRV